MRKKIPEIKSTTDEDIEIIPRQTPNSFQPKTTVTYLIDFDKIDPNIIRFIDDLITIHQVLESIPPDVTGTNPIEYLSLSLIASSVLFMHLPQKSVTTILKKPSSTFMNLISTLLSVRLSTSFYNADGSRASSSTDDVYKTSSNYCSFVNLSNSVSPGKPNNSNSLVCRPH